ncbi:MAG: sulfatase [Alphaproteobacteria bacterium]|nr:sulfatase [Alphaproteobacteria bacterium]
MRRPSLLPVLFLALCLGVGGGALEVGLRASPQMGLEPGELGTWLILSILLQVGFTLLAAVVGWALKKKPYGTVLGALLLVHGALWYRFELVLNEYGSDPKVWGGVLAIALMAGAAGWLLDELLGRYRVAVALVALTAGAVGITLASSRTDPTSGEPRGDRKNVVVITIDTLRADAISAYGSTNQTPAIDALARDGVLFETVVAAAPTTEPAHLAVFTGQPPYQSGVVANGTRLGDRPELLWHALKARGYTTAGFVAGFPLHGRFGWSQGMDVYDDDFGSIRGLHSLSLVKAWDQLFLPGHTLRERRGDQVVDRAGTWIRRHKSEPFFVWVHLFDPHAPYEAPGHAFDPPTDGEPLDLPGYWPPAHRAITSTDWLVDAYHAEVRYTDGLVGQLVATLRSAALLDDTVIVVTADHGESLTEHGYLFDHGDSLHDPSLLIPWVVRWPGVARAGHRVRCQVSNADVTPTLLSLLRLSADPGQTGLERAGFDRGLAVRGQACTERPVVSSTVSVRFVDTPPVDHSLRRPDRKLIRTGTDAVDHCYDLATDPGELAGGACDSAVTAELDALLAGGTAAVAPQNDSTTNAALEALGYIESASDGEH